MSRSACRRRFGLSSLQSDLPKADGKDSARSELAARPAARTSHPVVAVLDALTVRVSDLDDRLNNQAKATQRLISEMHATVRA